VVGEYKKRGITPDNTEDTHVTTSIQGIRARLMFYTGSPGWQEEWETFKEDLSLLAESTSRDRIEMTTDSLLTPTADTAGDLPMFDRKEFGNYVPKAPFPPATQD